VAQGPGDDPTADCDDIDPYTRHIAHASLRLCPAYRAPNQDGQTTTSLPYVRRNGHLKRCCSTLPRLRWS